MFRCMMMKAILLEKWNALKVHFISKELWEEVMLNF